MKPSRLISVSLASVLVLSAVAACGDDTETTGTNTACPGAENNPDEGVYADKVVIGGMSDLTGPASSVHIPHIDGVRAYFESVNAQGGINGRIIEYKVFDDGFVPEKGRANYRQLVDNEGVLAIAPINGSSVLTPLLPLIQEDEVPVIGPSHTINQQFTIPTLFNLMPPYSDISQVAAAYAAEVLASEVGGTVRLGVFSNNVASSYEWGEFQRQDIEALGGVFTEQVTSESAATQAQVQMRQLLEQNTNVLSVHGPPNTASLALQEQAKAGTSLPMVGSFPIADNAVWESNPELGKKLAVILPVNAPDETTPGGKALVEGLQKAGVQAPYSWWHTFGWINGMVVANAIERAGCDLDRAALVEALNTAPALQTDGLSGDVQFTTCDRVGLSGVRPYVYNYETKQLEGVGEFSEWSRFINNERYKDALPEGCS